MYTRSQVIDLLLAFSADKSVTRKRVESWLEEEELNVVDSYDDESNLFADISTTKDGRFFFILDIPTAEEAHEINEWVSVRLVNGLDKTYTSINSGDGNKIMAVSSSLFILSDLLDRIADCYIVKDPKDLNDLRDVLNCSKWD